METVKQNIHIGLKVLRNINNTTEKKGSYVLSIYVHIRMLFSIVTYILLLVTFRTIRDHQ